MKTFKSIMSWVLPIVVGLLVAMVIRHFIFTMVRVDGPSMEPNLDDNERVAVVKTAKIQHLSVIVFNAYQVDPDARSKTVKSQPIRYWAWSKCHFGTRIKLSAIILIQLVTE